MKTCQANNCTNPVFSKGFCRKHQWRRTDEGYLKQKKYRERAKKNKIAPVSDKMEAERVYYKKQAWQFWDDEKAKGRVICIFCGEEVTKFQGVHHFKGRVGDYLMDKDWWTLPHNDCHLQYHRSTVRQMTEAWGEGWWIRLAERFPSLSDKIRGREHKLNPTIFEDEDY